MTKFAIAGVGKDQPGVVSRVTEIICSHDGNIAESSMTRLAGQFTWMLVVTFSTNETKDELQEDFSKLMNDLGITFLLSELDEAATSETVDPDALYMISVSGSDKTGITHQVSSLLAKYNINITDLNAQTITGEDGPVYIMMMESQFPKGIDKSTLEGDFKTLSDSLGVEIRYHAIETVVT